MQGILKYSLAENKQEDREGGFQTARYIITIRSRAAAWTLSSDNLTEEENGSLQNLKLRLYNVLHTLERIRGADRTSLPNATQIQWAPKSMHDIWHYSQSLYSVPRLPFKVLGLTPSFGLLLLLRSIQTDSGQLRLQYLRWSLLRIWMKVHTSR